MEESAQLTDNGQANGVKSKERIINVALQLFCKKGYEATSVREIVEAAGVTKPVLYYYFKNKEDLLAHILQESIGQYVQDIDEICRRTDENVLAILNHLVELYRRLGKENPQLVQLINAICYSGIYNDVYDFTAVMVKITESVASVLERARQKDQLREDIDVHLIAHHLLHMLGNGMNHLVYLPESTSGDDLLDSAIPLLIDGAASAQRKSNQTLEA